MNQRIQELYEQARLSAKSIDADIDPKGWMDEYHRKFAELIVQRTLDIVEAHTEIFQSDEARAMVEHIKQSVKTDLGVDN